MMIIAVIDIIHNVINLLDEDKKLSSSFLGLSKAFDGVKHELLIAKLERYGIRGIIEQLLTSYLFNRVQYTEIKYSTGTNMGKVRSKRGLV